MTLALTEQLAYSTVRIEAVQKDGRVGTGTGFFFKLNDDGKQYVPVIVTNRHVIEGAHRGRFSLTTADEQGNPKDGAHKVIVIDGFEANWIRHPDPKIDLAVMPIAPLIDEATKSNIKVFFIPLDKNLLPSEADLLNLTAVEEVLMVGYPIGIWDSTNNLPVFRRGITATHPAKDYNGKNEFMIDAACFPGSSGSPVFLHNVGNYVNRSGNTIIGTRFKFLGILYAGPQYTANGEIRIIEVPTKQVPVASMQIPTNLGLVIKANAILDFEEIFKVILQQNPNMEEKPSNEPIQPTP